MDEFHKWMPSIPVVMYHGNQQERQDIFKTKMMSNLKQGRPNNKFPVVCTSYEMVLRDQHNLSRINWEFIIIVSAAPATHSYCCVFSLIFSCRTKAIA